MRLRRLRLECYGNFADTTLELDDRPGTLNLVVAPNGAGKSVLRRAISELLFGIHPQTPMGFRFDYNRMRLMAGAAFPDGQALGFARRKGRANTLTGHDGQPPHPSLPNRLPRETERKRLERLFMLDSAALREGGKALLQTDGDLADALLSSAGDLGSARTLATDFAARRDEAAPERKSARTPFYAAGEDWTAASARLAETLAKPAAVDAQERARAEAAAVREAANARAAAARAELARLARVRSTRRHLRDLDAAAAWLDANPAAPLLPQTAIDALDAAKAALAEAEREAAAARQLHAAAASELAGVAADPAVLAEAAAIEHLAATLAQATSARTDIPKRERELADARAGIGRLLRDLSSPADPADAAAELRPAADIAAARALFAGRAGLEAARITAAGAAADAQERLAQAEDDLAALPAAADTEALQAALAEATADGDPVRLAQAAAAASTEAAARLAAELARVPAWPGSAAALAALALPAEATLARLDRALTQARAQADAAAARQAQDAAALAADRQRLADLTGGRTLPDAASLAAARAHRDQGWALVFARLGGEPDPAAEAAYAPGTPLPLAFQHAMAAADAVADRRVQEAARLATAAELQTGIDRHAAALAASTAQARHHHGAAQDAATAWDAAIAVTALPAASGLAELRSFIAARDKVIQALESERNADAAVEATTRRQAGHAAQLAAALHTTPDSLPRLLGAARQRVAASERSAASRQALARTLVTARRAAANAATARDQAAAAMAAWTVRWQDALARLRRPADEPPDATAAVLDALIALPPHVEAADTAQRRIAEMRSELDRFAAACAAAAATLDDAGGDPAAAVARLATRLQAARDADARRVVLAGQATAAAARDQAAAAALARAQATLGAATHGVGAATVAEAEARVALAAQRLAQDAAHAAALARLHEDGDGRSIATLRAEGEATPAEAAAEATQHAEAANAAAQAAAQGAAAEQERAEGELRRLAAGQDAVRAAADRQAAAARLSRVLEDALVQHLAASMLDQGLHAVEATGSANGRLLRLGETFARLTGGAYDRLSPADDGKDSEAYGRLVAHEAGGGEKHIGQLSEGTRDQLYLALRLVAVEDHVQSAPPLPFVADDILQTFDDTRARAALEALVGLSHHVQVILLTHHPHVGQIAAGLPVHHVKMESPG